MRIENISTITEVVAKGFPIFKRPMLVTTTFKFNKDVRRYQGMHRSKLVAIRAAQEIKRHG